MVYHPCLARSGFVLFLSVPHVCFLSFFYTLLLCVCFCLSGSLSLVGIRPLFTDMLYRYLLAVGSPLMHRLPNAIGATIGLRPNQSTETRTPVSTGTPTCPHLCDLSFSSIRCCLLYRSFVLSVISLRTCIFTLLILVCLQVMRLCFPLLLLDVTAGTLR